MVWPAYRIELLDRRRAAVHFLIIMPSRGAKRSIQLRADGVDYTSFNSASAYKINPLSSRFEEAIFRAAGGSLLVDIVNRVVL